MENKIGGVKFSVITTVLNEAETIETLLDSLATQTFKPMEIVIADAGSTDGTQAIITQWAKAHKDLAVKLLREPGANRSVGRNKAIEATKHEHIAVIDAGCEADNHWLEQLTITYQETDAEVVAGFYLTRPKNDWERVFSLFLAIQPDQFDPTTYLPSSRSLAMTKEAWKKAGKYPEQLNTCEDLVFAKELKAKTKMTATNKAVVYWRLPKSLNKFFQTVAGYASGDVEARYWPHLRRIATIYGRYLIFLVWPWMLIVYLLYPQLKFIRRLSLRALLLSPVVQLVADAGVMWGGLKTLIKL